MQAADQSAETDDAEHPSGWPEEGDGREKAAERAAAAEKAAAARAEKAAAARAERAEKLAAEKAIARQLAAEKTKSQMLQRLATKRKNRRPQAEKSEAETAAEEV